MGGFLAGQATLPNTEAGASGRGQGHRQATPVGRSPSDHNPERHGNLRPQLVDITDNGGH